MVDGLAALRQVSQASADTNVIKFQLGTALPPNTRQTNVIGIANSVLIFHTQRHY
jgi:hypothetical protein